MINSIYRSPVGQILLTANDTCLHSANLLINEKMPPKSSVFGSNAVLEKCTKWLDGYFKGEDNEVDFALAPLASAYQQAVREATLNVKFGETSTYAAIARAAAQNGKHPCPRAAGGALHRNPIVIIVPCHRIISTSTALTGYACGLEVKKYLLNHENRCKNS
jgi:methylated-DNA-[protein]-cysteine S-methyltransferase